MMMFISYSFLLMGKAQRWWGGEHSQNKGLRTRWYILGTSPPPPHNPQMDFILNG